MVCFGQRDCGRNKANEARIRHRGHILATIVFLCMNFKIKKVNVYALCMNCMKNFQTFLKKYFSFLPGEPRFFIQNAIYVIKSMTYPFLKT